MVWQHHILETYLKAITTRAKDQRKTLIQKAKDSIYSVDELAKFTKLESKLQDVLGLSKIVLDEADRIFDEIQKIHPGMTNFTADILRKEIKIQVMILNFSKIYDFPPDLTVKSWGRGSYQKT